MPSSERSTQYDSWFGLHTDNRPTLEDFNVSFSPCILPLLEICTSLQEACAPFQQDEDILPFQCRKAIKVLTALCTQLEACIYLLKDVSSLPIIFLALRYRLLDEFHYMDEQAYKLIALIYKYNQLSVCSTKILMQQRKAINQLFASLLQYLGAIPQTAFFLLDEAQFQEKSLYVQSSNKV